MTWIDIVVLVSAATIVVAFFGVWLWRKKTGKSKGCGCGCDCSGCSSCPLSQSNQEK